MVGAIAYRPAPPRAGLAASGAPAAPIAGGPAEAGSVWADRVDFSGVAYRPPVQNIQPAQTYQAKSIIPFWAKAATFCAMWGIWGIPVALLGAVGFWAVEALGKAVKL